jgi:hypothetical protein
MFLYFNYFSLDLLRGQTRELVIIKLLNLCTENKDSIDGLILLILQKHEQINKTFKNRQAVCFSFYALLIV